MSMKFVIVALVILGLMILCAIIRFTRFCFYLGAFTLWIIDCIMMIKSDLIYAKHYNIESPLNWYITNCKISFNKNFRE